MQQQEGVEGGEGRAGVPQQDGPDVGDEGGGAYGIREGHAVIAGVGVGNVGKLAAGLPVKFAGIHDDAAQGGAVTADELGGGVNHNVGAVLDGPDQVGGAEGVVDDQGQTVLVGDGGDGVNVGNIGVGIAQGLQIDGLGVGLDSGFYLAKVVGVDESGGHAERRQGMGQQIVAAAVDGLLSHDVIACLGQGLNGVADGSRAGGGGQSCYAAFQCRDALFQHILCRVGEPTIDVASVRQTKPSGGVGGVSKDVGSGLVNGHRSGIGGGIGVFLTNVELQRFKFIVRHRSYLFHLIFRAERKKSGKTYTPGHNMARGQ